MAKNAVTDWDTTAANNTDVGGINIQGSASIANGDDALREIMEQIATFITAATFTGTSPVTLTSTDAGATAGPILTLYRNSASPAASDIIGKVLFQGEDSAGNTEDYAEIYASIADPTSTSEDASVLLRNKIAGTMTTQMTLTAVGASFAKPLLLTEGTAPTTAASEGALYTKDSGTQPELFYREESAGDEVQITRNGKLAALTQGTVVASTSGTNVELTTTLTAGVKRVTIVGKGVSTNGTDTFIIQIGDSGGYETSGYESAATGVTDGGSATGLFRTDGFVVGAHGNAADTINICATLVNVDGNDWVIQGSALRMGATDVGYALSGSKQLSGTLTSVKLTTVGGGTFDLGSMNHYYE